MVIPRERDAWPYIQQHLPRAIAEAQAMLNDVRGLEKLIESRYRAGEVLYDRDWLTWPVARFDQEAGQEAADLVCYLAMRRVFGDT
jgi:hypothetical protein